MASSASLLCISLEWTEHGHLCGIVAFVTRDRTNTGLTLALLGASDSFALLPALNFARHNHLSQMPGHRGNFRTKRGGFKKRKRATEPAPDQVDVGEDSDVSEALPENAKRVRWDQDTETVDNDGETEESTPEKVRLYFA